ncbi:MAG: hypothetical protein A2790_20080 [Phenylobacterium sp. RIFCSPHIGHO2_01_FULL_69_31]|uniref:hypothetical protein n=1 Tax=Phenylobacterium sp. RIFCSPHIGHO2_01_FULL_69_31 TaxID=1801944 RepID=UPI0008B1CAF4|nr:hypothetical protein [Phenylobacterium sp. RIFCSPHIGHO2_01_FULL_69_31]OHB26267.1 MAG: hypothetical protein A2790_20080 [Phenylobacterium sp. RIFCSPHIGHO2_01_FULL_69_31]
MKVFWSWQSDRPAKVCRDVIQAALTRALAELSTDLELEPSEGPELDHDTKGAAGMADIVATILAKIKEAGAFVGDITTVGKSDSGRELANPNVLIELGWAFAHLGHEPIILVANKSYGPTKPEKLPFDIRHRRAVIFYSLSKGADDDAIEAATSGLADEFAEALRASLKAWLAAQASDPGPAGRPSRANDPAVWFNVGASLSHGPFHGGGGQTSVIPTEGRRLYARIIPERFDRPPPTALQVHEHGSGDLRPLGPTSSGDGGLNGDGALRYAVPPDGARTTIWTAVQWFKATGELWSFDTLRLEDGKFFLPACVADITSFLGAGMCLLREFGASGLVRIEVGAGGLLGSEWNGQFNYERSDALIDRVQVSQARRVWDVNAFVELLTETVNGFAEAYGRAPPPSAEIRAMVSGALAGRGSRLR